MMVGTFHWVTNHENYYLENHLFKKNHFSEKNDDASRFSHLHLPANPKPSIPFGPAVLDLNDNVHLMRVGIGALEAALFGGVVDEDEWCARVRFAQGVHILDLQSGFGNGVYEYEVELPGVFGYAVGHVQARVWGFQAADFLLELSYPSKSGANNK